VNRGVVAYEPKVFDDQDLDLDDSLNVSN
jgi:hypothetical protein